MFQIILLVIETGFIVVLLRLLVEIVVETERYAEIRLDFILRTEIQARRDVGSDDLLIIELRNSGGIGLGVILETDLGVEFVTC